MSSSATLDNNLRKPTTRKVGTKKTTKRKVARKQPPKKSQKPTIDIIDDRTKYILGPVKNYIDSMNNKSLENNGVLYKDYLSLLDALGVTQKTFYETFHLSANTLKKREKNGGYLSKDESDKLYRFVNVFVEACEMLNSIDDARYWLLNPDEYFYDKPPIQVIDMTVGYIDLLNHIGRVRAGVAL